VTLTEQHHRQLDTRYSETFATGSGGIEGAPARTRFNAEVLNARQKRMKAFVDSTHDPEGTSLESESLDNIGIVQYPDSYLETPREIKLQEWEGQVQEVGSRYFSARLVDLTAGEREEAEEVDLPLDDLTESDRILLVPGATFRWIIGYRYTRGEKERFARIVIRRLPVWTEQEIRTADREAADLYNALFGDPHNRAATANRD